MARHDYAFPFRIDATSHQGAQAQYATHVDQMIRQVLLTSPGERADLPDFGCGLRQMLFAPLSEALIATAKIRVQQALGRWLSGQVQVQDIQVQSPAEENDSELLIQIIYVLVETQSSQQTQIRLV